MWRIIKQNAVSLTVMICLLVICWYAAAAGIKKSVYDCTLAEWHPDYPVKIREACRELRRSQSGSK